MAQHPAEVNLKLDEEGRAALTEVINITDMLCAEFTKLMDKNVKRNLKFAELLGDLITKNRALKDKLNKKQPIPEKDITELVTALESAHLWLKEEKLSTPLLDARKGAGDAARRFHDMMHGQMQQKVNERRTSAAPHQGDQLSEKEQLALGKLFQQKVDDLHQYTVKMRQHSKVQHPSFWEKLKQYAKAARDFIKLCFDRLLQAFGFRKDKAAPAKPQDTSPQGRMAAAGNEAAEFAQGNVAQRVAAIEEREAQRKQQGVAHKPTLTKFGANLKNVTKPAGFPDRKKPEPPPVPPRNKRPGGTPRSQ